MRIRKISSIYTFKLHFLANNRHSYMESYLGYLVGFITGKQKWLAHNIFELSKGHWVIFF